MKELMGLVIYDISDNKRRRKLSTFLNGFGMRVQKSAYEVHLSKRKYHEMIHGLWNFAGEEDSIRVYPIENTDEICRFGREDLNKCEEDIVFIA